MGMVKTKYDTIAANGRMVSVLWEFNGGDLVRDCIKGLAGLGCILATEAAKGDGLVGGTL
jgi:hypothetical protein